MGNEQVVIQSLDFLVYELNRYVKIKQIVIIRTAVGIYKNSVYDAIMEVQILFWRFNMHDRSCMGEDLNQLTYRLNTILQVIGGYTVVSSTPINEVLYK